MPQITIAGLQFEVEAPFAEGHQITAGQAAALNQTLRENVRNNMAKKVEDAKKAGKSQDEIQALVTAYASEYEFGVHSVGGRALDPVDRELRDIAEDKVKGAIKEKGKKLNAYSKEEFAALVDRAIERNPQWREIAERNVASRKAAANEVGDLLV